MNTWICKDNTEYHYHTSHVSICGTSDIIYNIAKTHDVKENPDVKCKTCIGILTSKGFFKVNLDKNRNDAREARFLQKYRESPVSLLVRYLASPENHDITTSQKLSHELTGCFDEININDILAESLVRGDIIYKDEKFHPKCNGVIVS